jgi:starch synthase
LDVLFVTVEMSPLAKVGGLGDVAGSLPHALRQRGVNVRVAMPMHSAIDRVMLSPRKVLDNVKVPWPSGTKTVDVWMADVREVPTYLIEAPEFFDRASVYGFDDDKDRFLFFCDSMLASASHLGFRPDVIHAQDWHTGLMHARLRALELSGERHSWGEAARVYTIHNLGLQGNFDSGFAHHHGIGAELLVAPAGVDPGLTYSGMAQGILHADRINTVSDTYANEILTPEYGAGLATLLRAREERLSGIVNGIDYEEFDPAADPHIAKHYDLESLDDRAANKRALQEEAGLPPDDGVLVFGVVTRLFAQKGIDLVPAALEPLLAERNAQLAVLGTGDEDVHRMLLDLEERHPGKVKVWLEFNPGLGQRVYAGCDAFLMPSRYEPCGLGQLISLRYGAVPIVRKTGGLSDTVVDAVEPEGTGFVFEQAEADALRRACSRALDAFADRVRWRTIQERGMSQDWSWTNAAGKYIAVYETAIVDRRRAIDEAAAAAS